MTISFEDKINFLRNQNIFNEISEEDLSKIARRWTTSSYTVDEDIFAKGSNDRSFYILYSGEIIEWEEVDEEINIISTLGAYDEFGSEAFIFNRSRIATFTSTKNSKVLTMTASNFEWLLRNFPQIKINMDALTKVHSQAEKLNFDWLHEGEIIYMITRRHPAELWIDLLKPVIALISSGLFLLVTRFIPGMIGLSTLIGGVLAIFSLLWIIWMGFDWQNDYFIITNERIVWVEEVILSRSSRQEIPLPQIQFVNVSRSYWGRVFNFGDVTIRTYTHTGNLRLTFVRDPMEFQALVDEQLVRSKDKEEESKTEALRHSIRQSLGMEIEIEDEEILEDPENEENFTLLKTRTVSYGEITYHKHWMVLLKAIWWQLVGLGAIAVVLFLKIIGSSDSFVSISMQTTLMGSFILGTILIFLLWYHFVDYRNDLYRLTSEMIIDLEKKPFGKEDSKTAPLKNIQSIRIAKHGLVQVLLNYGSVKVNVADGVLDFIYVHNPAQVQRDIFYKKRQLEISQEKSDTTREHERMTDYLKMYRKVWKDEDDQPNNMPEEIE